MNTRPVFEGSLEEVLEYYHRNDWTDGLPIVPPTEGRVQKFLEFSPRESDEVLATVLPSNAEVTVGSVAVNGVMAGCLPEYMPVLVAVTEAVIDPSFRLRDAGSTPGWEPIIIVSGPVVEGLKFNCETAALRVGPRANSSIGRYLRLFMRNVAGFKGKLDKGSIAQTFYVALAENESAVSSLGWDSFAVDRGFSSEESVVTVQSIVAASMPVYSAGERWTDHAELIAEVIGRGSWSYWAWTAMWFGCFHPLLVVSPNIAVQIAADGGTKEDLRDYLGEHVLLPASSFERYAWDVGITEFRLDRLVAAGHVPPAYVMSEDANRLLPALIRPEQIGIVVSGDPDRNQSKGFVQNHLQGPPVSKVVEFVTNSGGAA